MTNYLINISCPIERQISLVEVFVNWFGQLFVFFFEWICLSKFVKRPGRTWGQWGWLSLISSLYSNSDFFHPWSFGEALFQYSMAKLCKAIFCVVWYDVCQKLRNICTSIHILVDGNLKTELIVILSWWAVLANANHILLGLNNFLVLNLLYIRRGKKHQFLSFPKMQPLLI